MTVHCISLNADFQNDVRFFPVCPIVNFSVQQLLLTTRYFVRVFVCLLVLFRFFLYDRDFSTLTVLPNRSHSHL